MKRFELIKKVTLVIVCLSLVSVFTVEAEEAYPPAVMAAGEAVYQISMPGSAGTGFFIAPNLFVTNFHAIESIQDIAEVSFYFDNELSPIRVKKLLAVSFLYDLALLETEGESAVYLSEGLEPQLEETVFTIGYPETDDLQYHHSVSSIKNWQDMYYSGFFNFGTGKGSSGSPVLNSQGQFFGVIFGSHNAKKSFINSHWLELLIHGQIGRVCQDHARICVGQEVIRAKKLVQQFLAGQPMERESLGIIHIAGDALKSILSEENEEEAYLLKMAKDFNDVIAQLNLGIRYHDQGDLEKALYWWTFAAEGGMPVAQFNTGVLYHDQGDLEKALYWWTLAAESGMPLAQYKAGLLYRKQGQLEKAAYWNQVAAENGVADAQFNEGVLYHKQGDLEKAVYWYELAAEQGVRDAKFNLGILHRNQKNLEQALYWSILAAEDGMPLAQYNAGVLYDEQGQLEKATYWYKLSAEQGVSDACYNLSNMYRYGKGIEQSDELADYWMAKVHEIEGS